MLYGLLDEEGMIVREELWIPASGSTLTDLHLHPHLTWMTPGQFLSLEIPTIEIPDEPIQSP